MIMAGSSNDDTQIKHQYRLMANKIIIEFFSVIPPTIFKNHLIINITEEIKKFRQNQKKKNPNQIEYVLSVLPYQKND